LRCVQTALPRADDDERFKKHKSLHSLNIISVSISVFSTLAGHRGSITLSYIHSWRRRSTPTSQPSERVKKDSSRKSRGKRGSCQDNASVGWASLDTTNLDTQVNLERERGTQVEGEMKNDLKNPPLAAC